MDILKQDSPPMIIKFASTQIEKFHEENRLTYSRLFPKRIGIKIKN